MRRLISFLAAILVAASASAQTATDFGNRIINGTLQLGGTNGLGWNGNAQMTITVTGSNPNALIAQTTDTQGIPIIAWSESGAPALLVTQDTHFDNPALVVYRSGTAGSTTTSPTMLVQAGLETTGTTPVLQVGGCLALSGDNWYIVWGDGSLSLPGGFLDNIGKTKGKLSIDPVHRQLVAEDGLTPVLTWTGSSARISTAVVTGAFTIPTAPAPPSAPAPGREYLNTSDNHFYGWSGSAWKQLDN